MKAKMINSKKMLAVIITVLMTVLVLSSYQMKANAVNTAQTYKVYNATNGSYLRSYTLNPLTADNNTRSVIGEDERVIDWTKSGVVKIMTSNSYIGTGFVIDAHTIATAAHCVKNFVLSEILVFNSNGEVDIHATPVEYHYPQAYNTNSYLDYALITVEEDLSAYACFNLGITLDSFATSNQSLQVTGFSGDLNNSGTTHTMCTGNGLILDSNADQLFYTADTAGGNSGGPVYVTESRCGYTQFTVIAIHTNAQHDDIPGNRGTRITTNLLNFYEKNTNLNWE